MFHRHYSSLIAVLYLEDAGVSMLIDVYALREHLWKRLSSVHSSHTTNSGYGTIRTLERWLEPS